MSAEYHVKLIQHGNTQTLSIPEEIALSATEVIVRQEGEKLIIEPLKKRSLLEVLATLEDSEEDINVGDEDLLSLDEIEI
ncbi:MAG: AbrB/MazE/SpoVT family DNA-binding domain-containing protein [Cyanobacteria bacterium P01_G01_bin.19]